MMTQNEIKEKIYDVVSQFNTNDNGYVPYSELLRKHTLVVSDTLSFYVDENMQTHVLFAQSSDGSVSTCEPSIEHESITDYDCIAEISNIYVNKLDNSQQQYFIDGNSLFKNIGSKKVLVVCKAVDLQQFFNTHADVCEIEPNAFLWLPSTIDSLDLSKLDMLTAIPDYCFNCKAFLSSLASVVLPKNVEFIGESAFEQCEKLNDVESVDGFLALKHISYKAFAGCTSLVEMNLSNSSLSAIDGGAFDGCTSLLRASFPRSLSSMCAIFYDSYPTYDNIPLSSVDVSNTSIQVLNQYQFANCKALKDLILPPTMTVFEDNAVASCDALSLLSFENANNTVSIHINDKSIISRMLDDELTIVVKNNKYSLLTLYDDVNALSGKLHLK